MATTAVSMRTSVSCPVCLGPIQVLLISDSERRDCLALVLQRDALAEELEHHRGCGFVPDYPVTRDSSEPDVLQPYFLDMPHWLT